MDELEWDLTYGTSVDLTFPTWDSLKLDLLRVFLPPNQVYLVRSRFISIRQGKNEITDYVQALRTLMANMQSDPLPETVYVTVSMEGFRNGVPRTDVFRVHSSTLTRL